MTVFVISDVSHVYQRPRYQKDWCFQSYFDAIEYAENLVAEEYGTDFDNTRLITRTVGDTTYIGYKGYESVMTYYAVEAIKVR